MGMSLLAKRTVLQQPVRPWDPIRRGYALYCLLSCFTGYLLACCVCDYIRFFVLVGISSPTCFYCCLRKAHFYRTLERVAAEREKVRVDLDGTFCTAKRLAEWCKARPLSWSRWLTAANLDHSFGDTNWNPHWLHKRETWLRMATLHNTFCRSLELSLWSVPPKVKKDWPTFGALSDPQELFGITHKSSQNPSQGKLLRKEARKASTMFNVEPQNVWSNSQEDESWHLLQTSWTLTLSIVERIETEKLGFALRMWCLLRLFNQTGVVAITFFCTKS